MCFSRSLLADILFLSPFSLFQAAEYLERLQEINATLTRQEKEVEDIHAEEGRLGLPRTDFSILTETRASIQPYLDLWNLYDEYFTRSAFSFALLCVLLSSYSLSFYSGPSESRHWWKSCVFNLDYTAVEAKVHEMYHHAVRLEETFRAGGAQGPEQVAKLLKDNVCFLDFESCFVLYLMCDYAVSDIPFHFLYFLFRSRNSVFTFLLSLC